MRFLLVILCYGAGTALAFREVIFASCLFLWNDIFQPLHFSRNPGRFPAAYYVTGVLVLSYAWSWARGRLKPRFGAYFYLLWGLMAWVGRVTGASIQSRRLPDSSRTARKPACLACCRVSSAPSRRPRPSSS